MHFRDLKIGTKQKLAFGLILSAMAAVSMFSVNRLALLANEIETINSVWLQRTSVISSLNLNASLLRQNQLQGAFVSDDSQRAALADSMISLIDRLVQNIDVYDSLYVKREAPFPDPAREREVYGQFDQRWEDYLDLTFQILDLESQGQSDEAAQLLNREAGDVFSTFSESLSELVRINNQGAEEHTNAAVQTFVTSRRRIVVLFLVTLVVSFLIAAAIVRHITRSLQDVVAAARTVAEGNLDQKVPIRSKDEIGTLSASFNSMTDSLKKSNEHTRQQAEALREQGEALKAKNADLVDALERVEEAQEQLIISEKMASLGQLTAGIAHEIKNPLNFVNNFASLSEELSEELVEAIGEPGALTDEEVIDDVKEIAQNLRFNSSKILEHGVRADNIVKSMLQHSRGQVGNLEVVDLNQVIDEYTNLAFHGMRANDRTFNITIERDFDSGVGEVSVFPQEFGRVLLNILSNSFYATHKRAKSTSGYAPEVTISTARRGNRVVVSVSDNGGGVPADIETHIFEPFFTTKPSGSGTGLGLSLSYEIITKRHNGSLVLVNRPGEGAEFRITIPA